MTLTEKILAAHTGREAVKPGEFIEAKVDLLLANDITAPLAIEEFEKVGAPRVFDPGRIVLIPDHFTPSRDVAAAEQCKRMREFARRHQIAHYYEQGRTGIEHAFLPEQGLVGPGDLVIGADSHTCTYGALGALGIGVGSTDVAAAMITGESWFRIPETIKLVYKGRLRKWVTGKDLILRTIGDLGVDGALYKAMEFTGSAVKNLSMDSRFTMANMAIEAGAKNGIFAPDRITEEYVRGRLKRRSEMLRSDADAQYAQVREYDVGKISLQVALPHSPGRAVPVGKAAGVAVDQVVIGSCTNGRTEDLRVAAQILSGRKVHPNVRAIIIPATQEIYLQALKEGLLKTFVEAGCVVSTPTCGPCIGGHMGVLAKGERCLSTTNRNFLGRMGHPQSEVYLAGPAVAAATAVAGEIVSPGALS